MGLQQNFRLNNEKYRPFSEIPLGSSGDGIEEVGILPIKLRENKKSDVKVGADECFLIVTFIFQTILCLVVVHLRYCGDEHHA